VLTIGLICLFSFYYYTSRFDPFSFSAAAVAAAAAARQRTQFTAARNDSFTLKHIVTSHMHRPEFNLLFARQNAHPFFSSSYSDLTSL